MWTNSNSYTGTIWYCFDGENTLNKKHGPRESGPFHLVLLTGIELVTY